MPKVRILAIRHPEYAAGTGDSWAAPLTEAGLAQAQRIAIWIAGQTRGERRDPRVLCSRAERSRQLAAEIGRICKVEVEQAAWVFRGPHSVADLVQASLGETTVVLATHLDCIVALLALAGTDASEIEIEYGEVFEFNLHPEDDQLGLNKRWKVD